MFKVIRVAGGTAERQLSRQVSCRLGSCGRTNNLRLCSKHFGMASALTPHARSEAVESGTATSVFLVTSPTAAVSRKIAESLLSKRLAACVNVVPRITSLYWWDGKVQEDSEELLVIKSRDELTTSLEAEIKSLHPYDTPEFIRLPITAGSEDYLDWVRRSTKPE